MEYRVFVDDDDVDTQYDEQLGYNVRQQVEAVRRQGEPVSILVPRNLLNWQITDVAEFVYDKIREANKRDGIKEEVSNGKEDS